MLRIKLGYQIIETCININELESKSDMVVDSFPLNGKQI
jgi:hypothetical protein